jgi:hypothetical protein
MYEAVIFGYVNGKEENNKHKKSYSLNNSRSVDCFTTAVSGQIIGPTFNGQDAVLFLIHSSWRWAHTRCPETTVTNNLHSITAKHEDLRCRVAKSEISY